MGKKLIVREWLDFKRLSVRKLAELIPNGEPGYRTIDEFIRRGGGTMFTAAAISDALELSLTDIYIDENEDPDEFIQNHPKGGCPPPPKQAFSAKHREMDNAIKTAQGFANTNDGVAGKAAGDFAQTLRLKKFTDYSDFEALCNTFLKARASDINQLDPETIDKFVKTCAEKKADEEIEHLAFTFMNPKFDISLDAFTNFAASVGNAGYDDLSKELFLWAKKQF